MSAWAIFSMMGLYPDNPGDPSYTLTTPVFDKVTLHLDPKFYPQGDITIETDRTSPSQLYIKSMTLGGKKLNGYRISHKQLVEGKDVIIVDDMIDSAGTLTKAANVLKEMGAKSVRACATHAVLSGPISERYMVT